VIGKRLGGVVPNRRRGRTKTGQLWVYVRDDRPYCGGAPLVTDGRLEMDKNIAEDAMRCIAVGRKKLSLRGFGRRR